jgi:purine-binding chemotaxis protein CheW
VHVLPPEADEPGSSLAAVADDAVVARMGAGRFAIPLTEVAEVGKVPSITRVPGVPAWVAGVANWRGRILPVLDLRTLLGADPAPIGPTARLMVLTADGNTVAAVVDGVEGMTAIGAEVAAVPTVLPGVGGRLVRGQVPRDEGPLALLDVPAVMRLRESLPRARHSA